MGGFAGRDIIKRRLNNVEVMWILIFCLVGMWNVERNIIIIVCLCPSAVNVLIIII